MIEEGVQCACVILIFMFVFSVAGCGGSPAPIVVSISPQAAAVGTGQTVQFTATVQNDSNGVVWAATQGTIDAAGNYTASPGTQSTIATITATSKKDSSKSASATINVVAPGQISSTNNVQVALYTIRPPALGNVSVEFGTNTSYGLTTWSQPTPQSSGNVSLFVAGMLANTLYHIRGVIQFADGTQFTDVDQTFTTGALPAGQVPSLTVTTTPGMTPQPGVEFLDLLGNSDKLSLVVTDLSGNPIWTYNPGSTVPAGSVLGPYKLLPNGHILANFASSDANGLGLSSILQEIDLGGNVVWQMTSAQLNQALTTATCAECNVTILSTHHDFAVLPNGHLILLTDTQQSVSGTTVTGDVAIDLDQNHKPVWAWNEFNHLDINRRPMNYPDWTHTNAVIYSSDDGNFIVSIRHQNWLVKVDYNNGSGSGDIIWHLGYQGDFSLVGGSDPVDWFYAQHGPSFVTTNTTGKFTLTLFDNGNDRASATGFACGGSGQPPCFYSTVPILQLDETAKTATLSFHPTAPTYSFFGGNSEILKNGNLEFCESAEPGGVLAGDIYEITQDTSAQTVWHMQIAGQFAYRGFRMPSLYPGVQW